MWRIHKGYMSLDSQYLCVHSLASADMASDLLRRNDSDNEEYIIQLSELHATTKYIYDRLKF